MFVPGFTPTDSSISILMAAPVLNLHTVSATHNFTFRTPQNLTLGQRSQTQPFSDSFWFRVNPLSQPFEAPFRHR